MPRDFEKRTEKYWHLGFENLMVIVMHSDSLMHLG